MITFVGVSYIDGFVSVGVLSCGKCLVGERILRKFKVTLGELFV